MDAVERATMNTLLLSANAGIESVAGALAQL